MKDIKFEYIINIDGKIHKQVLDLLHIESGDINANGVPLSKLSAYKQVIARRQYTGLHDKNDAGNTDVYEHDILYNGEGQYYKVEWDYRDTGWCGINTYNNNKKNLTELLMKYSIVVGNIYENKDLLC